MNGILLAAFQMFKALFGRLRARRVSSPPPPEATTPLQKASVEEIDARWITVRVKKTRQNRKGSLRSDSLGTEKALMRWLREVPFVVAGRPVKRTSNAAK